MNRLLTWINILSAVIFADITGVVTDFKGEKLDSVKITFEAEMTVSFSDTNGVFNVVILDDITSLNSQNFSDKISSSTNEVTLYNLLGEKLFEQSNVSLDDNIDAFQNLSQGIYILQIQNDQNQWVLKFQKTTKGLKLQPSKLSRIYETPVGLLFEKVGYEDTVIMVSTSSINLGTIQMQEIIDSSSSSSQNISSSSFVHVLDTGSFIDSRDGKTYSYTKIGEQIWMAQNLNYETLKSKCYGGFVQNCDRYGRLYTWRDAMNGDSTSIRIPSGVQGLCPEGWHLPSSLEWGKLKSNIVEQTGLGSSQIGDYLKSTNDFYHKTGTDEFGFRALASGYLNDNGYSEKIGYEAYWWSSTEEYGLPFGYKRASESYLMDNNKYLAISMSFTDYSYSIRCLKNEDVVQETPRINWCETAKNCGTFTDRRVDKVYKWTKIGKQTWMAENLNYETNKSYCYKDEEENCETNGRLYEWEMVKSSNLCPKGWKIPNNAQWDSLTTFIALNSEVPLEKVGEKLKSTSGWFSRGYGSDEYGFESLPVGTRNHVKQYSGDGFGVYWWSTDDQDEWGYAFTMGFSNDGYSQSKFTKKSAFPVRCILSSYYMD